VPTGEQRDAEPGETDRHQGDRGDARAVINRFGRTPKPDAVDATRLSELSQREREVLLLLVEGCANREIAERLFISEATVKTHVMAVLRKVGLRDRIQAVIFRIRVGAGPARPLSRRAPRPLMGASDTRRVRDQPLGQHRAPGLP